MMVITVREEGGGNIIGVGRDHPQPHGQEAKKDIATRNTGNVDLSLDLVQGTDHQREERNTNIALSQEVPEHEIELSSNFTNLGQKSP